MVEGNEKYKNLKEEVKKREWPKKATKCLFQGDQGLKIPYFNFFTGIPVIKHTRGL